MADPMARTAPIGVATGQRWWLVSGQHHANDTSVVLQWLQQHGVVGSSEQPAGYQNRIWLGYKP